MIFFFSLLNINEEKKDIIFITDKKEGKMDSIHIFMDEYEDKDKDIKIKIKIKI